MNINPIKKPFKLKIPKTYLTSR